VFPRQKVHYIALPGLSEQKGKRSLSPLVLRRRVDVTR
jgi:hypothetical protein